MLLAGVPRELAGYKCRDSEYRDGAMSDHMPIFDEDWEEWDASKGSFTHHMIAGSCAGVMEHIGMFPLDTYKVCGLVWRRRQ